MTDRTFSLQGLHKLPPNAVRTLSRPGWHADGGGLYLEIGDNGRKRWALRLQANGKRRDFGLGSVTKVTLADARERAAEYRRMVFRGEDPIAHRKVKQQEAQQATTVITFAEAAEKVFRQRLAGWSNGKHTSQWITTLETYAYPYIGKLPVNEIGTAQVLKVLTPIWLKRPETARRVRQRIGTILDWARAADLRTGDNPVNLLGDALPRQKKSDQHHTAMPYVKVPVLIQELRAGSPEPLSKLAFEFLILTAARTKEVRGARWSEINVEAKTWTIPGHDLATNRRMKAGREHVVPLSDRCLEILDDARVLSGSSALIFPVMPWDRQMSENRFLVVRTSLGYGADDWTPHGFRSSFRDWAAEETEFPPEVAEMALAHTIKNKTEAAYRRGQLLAKRRELMAAWADHVCGTPKSSSIVTSADTAA